MIEGKLRIFRFGVLDGIHRTDVETPPTVEAVGGKEAFIQTPCHCRQGTAFAQAPQWVQAAISIMVTR